MSKGSTQQFLEIGKIKEGVLILKNKSLRGLLMTSSLNFALKSEDEQTAIIYQFQNFLNSLDFSIEIAMQSRKLNITAYLEKLEILGQKQSNQLLKIQTQEYKKFIENLITRGSIMSKTFFVVVPFDILGFPSVNLLKQNNVAKQKISDEQFQRAKAQLWQRMEFVALGLKRCGLKCTPLNSTELIELFWSVYHPEEAEVGYYPEIPQEIIE